LQVRYTNVANCFHLFSLLQTAIGKRLPGGKAPNASITAAARGISDSNDSDHAWWHYGDPFSPKPDLNASVWGEALVRTIPFVDDVQVILLWPPILSSRGWDSGFFSPRLEPMPPDLVVERDLTDEEAERWMKRLGIASTRKRWWPW
jgi:hypothetical protein